MDKDSILTDAAGAAIILIGLGSLTEALLQVELLGESLPLIQGTVISLFAISFGGVLITESATVAFKRLRLKCTEMIKT